MVGIFAKLYILISHVFKVNLFRGSAGRINFTLFIVCKKFLLNYSMIIIAFYYWVKGGHSELYIVF